MQRFNDAIANTFTMQGQNFYAITFPSGDKTFIISESLGVNGWFEISSGVDAGAYQCNTVINCYGKNFAFDKSNGNAYELDLETYTNNGDPIQRVRVTGSINGETVGARGKRVQMSEANILMETGVGLIEGQGDNPRIMVEYSDDGGRSWSHGEWPQTGRLGQFNIEVKWFNLLSFYDRIVRISTTDPVNYTVYNATIDLRLAGK